MAQVQYIMCEETALMRFVYQFENNAILQKLQNRISERMRDASDDEIVDIVFDEMLKYHEETASLHGRNTPNNQYPTEEERGYFADIALYNLIPHKRIPEDISSAGLIDRKLKMRECLKKLQDINEEANQEDNKSK